MMEFERAIEDAETLYLFDRRSQRQLQEMADDAPANSKDRYLIRLTQAAFAYYNASDNETTDISRTIRQAMGTVQEIKRFREDRVFFTLALRLEVDLLMHQSALKFLGAKRENRSEFIFNEEDARALSICETLLKNFPDTFDPLPSAWYSGVIPLFPIFREETVQFYQDRLPEHRMIALTAILFKIRHELNLASGIIQGKRFISVNNVTIRSQDLVHKYLIANISAVGRFIERNMPQQVHISSDVTVPRGINQSQLESAITNVEGQIEQSRKDKDIRKFTGHLLQLGILNFLDNNFEASVNAFVRTLKASARIAPEDKQLRQFQHERFPDIPFMMGTCYLKALVHERQPVEFRQNILGNSISGLMRALVLQRRYHQAYVNLLVAFNVSGDSTQRDQLFKVYLDVFGNDMAELNAHAFRNLAHLAFQHNDEAITPEIVQWLILSEFCTGGELTKAQQILQELKTLYILNAHDFSIGYLDTYRSALRLKDEEFVTELENTELHSALLFYIAHAFTSLSLLQGRNNEELVIEYANLDQGIELNAEALYFNPRNLSCRRLVETQTQIIQFAMRRTQRRWENINQTMGQRFQFYEDYLRQEKCLGQLRDRLSTLELEQLVPDLQISDSALSRMHEVITREQRERLKHRVELT